MSQDSFEVEPSVFIVVLNYRNYEDTIECVCSIDRIEYRNYQVVIVDNDSGGESEDRLRSTFPHHRVVQSGENRGFSAGNNVGIRIAIEERADYVLVLNNDTIVEPNFLSILVGHAEQDASAGMLSPQMVDPNGRFEATCARRRPSLLQLFWNDGVWRLGRHARRIPFEGGYSLERPTEVEMISGSCMLLRCSLIEEMGLLDEETFLYKEEFILCEKLRATSFRTILVPAARVVHKGGRSVEGIGTRAIWANLHSLNYYLRQYRKARLLPRTLIMLSTFCLYLPGLVKTGTGLRRAERWVRQRRDS